MVDVVAECEIIEDEEREGMYVVAVSDRVGTGDTDSASSGRSQSSRMKTSTRTLRSLL